MWSARPRSGCCAGTVCEVTQTEATVAGRDRARGRRAARSLRRGARKDGHVICWVNEAPAGREAIGRRPRAGPSRGTRSANSEAGSAGTHLVRVEVGFPGGRRRARPWRAAGAARARPERSA